MREIFKNGWLKFGCYITGYNYNLLKDCSEISKNYLKKITSALLIVSIIWAFIGFLFCTKYLQLPYYGAAIGSFIMLIVVIQIERQIILSIKPSLWTKGIRVLLGLIIAIIGSTIVDQVLFKNDIEIIRNDNAASSAKKRTEAEDAKFSKTQNIILTEISKNNRKLADYELYLRKHPTIVGGRNHIVNRDTNGTVVGRGGGYTNIANPLIAVRESINGSITNLNKDLNTAADEHLNKVVQIQNAKLAENRGFLDELGIMKQLIWGSGHEIALGIYSLWFLFFLIIELFILFSKAENHDNDYDRILEYQMGIRETRLKALQDKTNSYLGENLSVNQSKSLVDRFPS